jgi:hypothetical protein
VLDSRQTVERGRLHRDLITPRDPDARRTEGLCRRCANQNGVEHPGRHLLDRNLRGYVRRLNTRGDGIGVGGSSDHDGSYDPRRVRIEDAPEHWDAVHGDQHFG